MIIRHLDRLDWVPRICLLLIISSPSFAHGEQGRIDLGRQIHETIEQLHAARLDHSQQQKQFLHQRKAIEDQIARLESDLQKVDTERATDKQDISSLVEGSLERSGAYQKASDQLASISRNVLPYLHNSRYRTQAGIPYHRDRRTQLLDRIGADLADPDPVVTGQAIIDYMGFIWEELRLSHSIEFWNESVRLPDQDRRVHAYQVRMGLVNQAFVSEDGQWFGLASMTRSTPWTIDLSDQTREQIISALKILQNQQPPRLTPVLFRINPDRPGPGDPASAIGTGGRTP